MEVVENLKLDAKGVTFNSAPIKNPTGNVYEHVNLQLSGGNILNTDIVSAFGKQLGENYKVVSKEINNPISAHLLSNFKHIQNENPAFVKDDLSKVLNHIKQGKDYFEYQAEANNEKSRTVYSIPSVSNQKDSIMSDQVMQNKDVKNQLSKMDDQLIKNLNMSNSLDGFGRSGQNLPSMSYQKIEELAKDNNLDLKSKITEKKDIEITLTNNDKLINLSINRDGEVDFSDNKKAIKTNMDDEISKSFISKLENSNKPVANIYHGQNSKMVAQLETNSSNANGKSIEHVNNDSKKLEELQNQKKSFNQSVESLKKSDLKEFQDLKEKGYKIEVHDLSNQKGKSVQEEKSNIEELKKIADSYKQAEVPRAGKSYSGVVLAQGEDTTIQKTPTGKFIVHETENLQQMKVSDTHRNQSIKYVTDKQTDVKSIGYDELKKSQTQEAKQPEQSKSNSNSFER